MTSIRTRTTRALRNHALATACALLMTAPTSFASPDNGVARINTSMLKEGQSYDRFIVKYRAGSSELASSSMRAQALNQAGMLQGLGSVTCGGPPSAPT